jgi:G:T-mismatch repair DNA endonuclease (very short patch repair protein)
MVASGMAVRDRSMHRFQKIGLIGGRKNWHKTKRAIELWRGTLRSQGWEVIRVWECSLTRKNLPRTAKRLKRKINQFANLVGA